MCMVIRGMSPVIQSDVWMLFNCHCNAVGFIVLAVKPQRNYPSCPRPMAGSWQRHYKVGCHNSSFSAVDQLDTGLCFWLGKLDKWNLPAKTRKVERGRKKHSWRKRKWSIWNLLYPRSPVQSPRQRYLLAECTVLLREIFGLWMVFGLGN